MAPAGNEPYRPLRADIDPWSAGATLDTAQELFAILDVIDGNGSLRRALTDPSRAAEDRAGLVHRLFDDRAGRSAVEITAHLVRQRAAHERQLGDGIETTAVTMAAVAAENRGGAPALESLVDELIEFKALVEHSEQIQGAFADSRAGAAAKARLASRLAPRASAEGALLMQRAVSEPRGALPGRLLERFTQVVAERQQRWIARVVTSRPLSEEQLGKLRAGLNRLYERDLKLAVEVDPALIGGLRVQVGKEIIDGSVTHRLGQLQQRIAA